MFLSTLFIAPCLDVFSHEIRMMNAILHQCRSFFLVNYGFENCKFYLILFHKSLINLMMINIVDVNNDCWHNCNFFLYFYLLFLLVLFFHYFFCCGQRVFSSYVSILCVSSFSIILNKYADKLYCLRLIKVSIVGRNKKKIILFAFRWNK